MLPCQSECLNYKEGCHKECQRWKMLQAEQKIQRQRKKEYLNYYNELYATVAQQFHALRRTLG